MTEERNYTLVNGAGGLLGRAIVKRLDPQRTLMGARTRDVSVNNSVAICSDGIIDPEQFNNVENIVNCVGKTKGTPESIWESNVTHPVNLAAIAKASGVRRFIQISSFAIFGNAPLIGSETPILPLTIYGKSKAKAEQELLSLQDGNFIVICVRLPMLFEYKNSLMIDSLIKFMKISPIFPMKNPPVKRSMITYQDAADIISVVCTMQKSGPVFAADTNFFTFQMLFDFLKNAGISCARPFVIPNFLIRLIIFVLPSIGVRLFSSSILNDKVNLFSGRVIKGGIQKELETIVKNPGSLGF